MNPKIERNWMKLEGSELPETHDDSKVMYVNRHTGVCVAVSREHKHGSTHVRHQRGRWNVCLPSGFMCQSFEKEKQAVSFLKNWMIQNPSGRSDVKYNQSDKEEIFGWIEEAGVKV